MYVCRKRWRVTMARHFDTMLFNRESTTYLVGESSYCLARCNQTVGFHLPIGQIDRTVKDLPLMSNQNGSVSRIAITLSLGLSPFHSNHASFPSEILHQSCDFVTDLEQTRQLLDQAAASRAEQQLPSRPASWIHDEFSPRLRILRIGIHSSSSA